MPSLQLGLAAVPGWSGGILAGVVMTIIPGLVNGWLIAQIRVPPFIGTLGMYGVARGSAYLFGRRHHRLDQQHLAVQQIGNGQAPRHPVP